MLVLVGIAAAWSAGCGGRTAPTLSQNPPAASGGSPTPAATSAGGRPDATEAARARAALQAFVRAFYVTAGGGAYWALDTAGGQATFYRQAEMLEMVEDAYAGTGDPAYRSMIVALERGVTAYFGRSWLWRPFNDDIMWMIIASLRAYELTGSRRYLTLARLNFDATYARSWSPDLGGGLWWTTLRVEKNVTTNAPAAIAACKLAADLHDPTYLAKAKSLYAWVRTHLYDPLSGAVYDGISPGGAGVPSKARYTYNQGTFIGAANLLYQATGRRTYVGDALRALEYTQAGLTVHGGILPREAGGPDSNGGGFKGIFCRWAVGFVRDNHISSFDGWFQRNADSAWSNRDARGLMGPVWWRPTSPGLLYAWDCSSAVVLLQVFSAR